MIAERLGIGLNRSVIVENKTGAAGRIGVLAVKNAAADGTTLLDRSNRSYVGLSARVQATCL